MAQVFRGRYTARSDEPFVVFLIGMRINQLGGRAQMDACRGGHASDRSGAQEESRQGSAWPGKLETGYGGRKQ